jgi:hypothetical protein
MFNSFNDAGVGDSHAGSSATGSSAINYVDLAVDGVRTETARIIVGCATSAAWRCPSTSSSTYADGTSERVHRTPAAWQADGRGTKVRIAGGKVLRSVTLDTGIFVDANPGDNTWAADKAGSR